MYLVLVSMTYCNYNVLNNKHIVSFYYHKNVICFKFSDDDPLPSRAELRLKFHLAESNYD